MPSISVLENLTLSSALWTVATVVKGVFYLLKLPLSENYYEILYPGITQNDQKCSEVTVTWEKGRQKEDRSILCWQLDVTKWGNRRKKRKLQSPESWGCSQRPLKCFPKVVLKVSPSLPQRFSAGAGPRDAHVIECPRWFNHALEILIANH